MPFKCQTDSQIKQITNWTLKLQWDFCWKDWLQIMLQSMLLCWNPSLQKIFNRGYFSGEEMWKQKTSYQLQLWNQDLWFMPHFPSQYTGKAFTSPEDDPKYSHKHFWDDLDRTTNYQGACKHTLKTAFVQEEEERDQNKWLHPISSPCLRSKLSHQHLLPKPRRTPTQQNEEWITSGQIKSAKL